MDNPASALIKALEASIALYQDELTGIPDWSIGIDKFCTALEGLGFEIVERHNDGSSASGSMDE